MLSLTSVSLFKVVSGDVANKFELPMYLMDKFWVCRMGIEVDLYMVMEAEN